MRIKPVARNVQINAWIVKVLPNAHPVSKIMPSRKEFARPVEF